MSILNIFKKKKQEQVPKVLAETKWCEYYNKTKEDFIKRYGRSYL